MRNDTQQWTLQETLVEDLEKLLCLEKAFLMTLPMMAQSASNVELQEEFERLCCQTREQIERLHRLIVPTPSNFLAPVEERQAMPEGAEPCVLDGLLITELCKKQHAKIALYSTVCLWAHQLGLKDMERLLAQNLQEEETNCGKLLQLAHEATRPTP